MAYPTLVERIAELVKYQLPAFIREDHQNFITFMAAYYEWMETRYKNVIQPYYGSANLINFADLDKTLTEFIQYFSNEFLVHIPAQILCDRKKLLKNIKQFYRSRGNEKAFELLFRILFRDEIGFYYPTVDILRPDEGKWVLKKAIRCIRPKDTAPFDLNVEFIGKKIIGYRSGASGVVDYIVEYDAGYAKIYEIFFKKNSIYGDFIPWETVALSNNSINKLQIQPILIRVDVSYGGIRYSLNSPVVIQNDYGVKMDATIREVDPDGVILDVQVLNPGFGYPLYPVDEFTAPKVIFEPRGIGGVDTAIATAIIGALFEHPGYYVTTDGFLDTVEKLRDDYYYQEFSYVLRTHNNLVDWYDVVHKIAHPAGTIVFNDLLIEPDLIAIGPKVGLNKDGTTGAAVAIRFDAKHVVDVFNGLPVQKIRNVFISDGQYIEFLLTNRLIQIPLVPAGEDRIEVYVNDVLSTTYRIVGDNKIIFELMKIGLTATGTTLYAPDGVNLRSYLQTGTVIVKAETDEERTIISVSPDGKEATFDIAFADGLFDDEQLLVYNIPPIGSNVEIIFYSEYQPVSITKRIQDTFQQDYTKIGSTYSSVNRDAFRNIPTQMFPTNMLVLPDQYLNDYANYSLCDLADLKLDYLVKGTKKIDLQPRVTVKVGFHVMGTITTLIGGAPLSNILVSITGPGVSLSTYTNSFGEYFFDGLPAGTYDVTPTDSNWDFGPTSLTIILSSEHGDGADFQAEALIHYISGTITSGGLPVPFVDVYLTGHETASTQTGPTGEYVFSNLSNGSYTITPELVGYTFDPDHSDVEFTFGGPDNIDVDFESTVIECSINGTITVGGLPLQFVDVELSGDSSQTTQTDINGEYSFTGLLIGSYTITPSLIGYEFTPDHNDIIFSLGGPYDVTSDFTATDIGNFISGTLTDGGLPIPNVDLQLIDLNLDLTGFDGQVNAIINDGIYWYVGGSFTSYKGTTTHDIAKINMSTGALDPGFSTGVGFAGYDGAVRALAINGTDLYAGGYFTSYQGVTRGAIAKLSAIDGSIDLTFNANPGCIGSPSPVVNGIIISGGSLYLSGAMLQYNGTTRQRFCKVDATTAALDPIFDTSSGFNSETLCLALDGNDLYIGGGFTSYKGSTRQYIVKVNATNAAIDTGFNTAIGFDNRVRNILISGSDLYCAGEFTAYKGNARQRIARIDRTNATINATFDSSSGFDNHCRRILLDTSDNTLICAGDFTTYNGVARQRIAKVDATTAVLNTDFDSSSGFDGIVLAINLYDNNIYAAGLFTQYYAYARQRFAKINSKYAHLDTIQIAVVGDDTNDDGFYLIPNVSNSSYVVKPIWTGDVYTPSHVYVTILDNYVENVDFSKV